MVKIGEYLKETRTEMKHVNWPTRKQSIAFTAIVIGITLVFAAFLGFFDYIFTMAIQFLI